MRHSISVYLFAVVYLWFFCLVVVSISTAAMTHFNRLHMPEVRRGAVISTRFSLYRLSIIILRTIGSRLIALGRHRIPSFFHRVLLTDIVFPAARRPTRRHARPPHSLPRSHGGDQSDRARVPRALRSNVLTLKSEQLSWIGNARAVGGRSAPPALGTGKAITRCDPLSSWCRSLE